MSNFSEIEQAVAALEIPTVYEQGGQLWTTSKDVASYFGKRPADVMRSIDNAEFSADFRERNFALSSYRTSQNRELPCYAMTQDGFSFIVMGYTGSEAARFKEAYINEFNRMREVFTAPVTTSNSLLNALVATQRQTDSLALELTEMSHRHDVVEQQLTTVTETTDLLAEAMRGIECPPGHMSVGDIKRQFTRMSEAKIQSVMDNLNWPFTYFTVPVPGGFNRSCKGYAVERESIGERTLRGIFQRISREATAVSPYYYTHPWVTGRFQL